MASWIVLDCCLAVTALVAATDHVAIHRARSRSLIGFEPAAFAEMARAELTASLPAHGALVASRITEPLAWSHIRSEGEQLTDAAVRAAVGGCALTHGVYRPCGSGASVAEAAEAAAANLGSPNRWSSWSLRALSVGALARPSLLERAQLLGPAESILLAAVFGTPASASWDGVGAPAAAGHARLVAVFGAADEVHILRLIGSGAAVPADGYDYAPTGTPHKHGRVGRLGDYTRAVRPRALVASTAMVAEVAFLMCNLARVRVGTSAYDPCMGSGSLLVAAGMLGATCLAGSDADPRATARTAASLASAGLPPAERLAVSDVAALVEAGSGGGDIDAIVCDPPYGIKEASLGGSVASGVLRLAARRLRVGGRLVIFLPVAGGRAVAAAAPLPPACTLGLRCVGEWRQDFRKSSLARVLRVYERMTRADGVGSDTGAPATTEGAARVVGDSKVWSGGGPPNRVRLRGRRAARRDRSAGGSAGADDSPG
eukprot:5105052-Prymnesium_polylepis.1